MAPPWMATTTIPIRTSGQSRSGARVSAIRTDTPISALRTGWPRLSTAHQLVIESPYRLVTLDGHERWHEQRSPNADVFCAADARYNSMDGLGRFYPWANRPRLDSPTV